jgi:EAL domain-containing protein (putative c-di-GMP-specific phosphodiesterase class I)
VHETTVTDPRSMRELRAALTALGIGLAFDDFGAGQSRLLELAESPPDYLKFDIHLIHDIHNAPASRQSMVENLVSIVRDMGVYCLAEGIECQEELDTCVQMGFEFGQGYLLGRPQPAQAWQSTDE